MMNGNGSVASTGDPIPEAIALPASSEVERDVSAQERGERDGKLSVFTCPECGGSLWQANAGTALRFRCHIGHVLSADSLLDGQSDLVERALWSAVRTLRDKARLGREMATGARGRGMDSAAARFDEKAQLDDENANVIERMVVAVAGANQ